MASTPLTYQADLEAPAPRGFAVSIARTSLGRVAARFARAIAQELRMRRDTRELMAMNDQMLKDIGLTRAQIGFAVRYGRD